VAYDNEYCILDNKFRDLVTEKQGFEWVDEAKPESYVRNTQVQRVQADSAAVALATLTPTQCGRCSTAQLCSINWSLRVVSYPAGPPMGIPPITRSMGRAQAELHR
jgi:hypothetical protein